MIAATCTMWDTLSWGGETQALIYNPKTGKVVGINALGVAPTGATPEFFRSKGMAYPPEYGPLAAVTPGTPGGIMVMLAEYGKLSLAEVLAPAIDMADGYPVEQQHVSTARRQRDWLLKWPESRRVLLPHPGDQPPEAGEIFRQPDLAATLRKLVEAETAGAGRRQEPQGRDPRRVRPLLQGRHRAEFVRGSREVGGLHTARGSRELEGQASRSPVKTAYKGIDVYKLDVWTQGPAMLQALNILEPMDLKAMGYNSARYIHALYQAMNLAFADRDFYYGDPDFPPEEPTQGPALEGVRAAAGEDDRLGEERPERQAGRSLSVPGTRRIRSRSSRKVADGRAEAARPLVTDQDAPVSALRRFPLPLPLPPRRIFFSESFYAGTTSVEAADAEGWVVSVTPSGGWLPAVIAGKTGIGMSQRMQSFVLDPRREPVQRARARQAPARDADADAGAEGRQAVPCASPCRAATRRTRTSSSSS